MLIKNKVRRTFFNTFFEIITKIEKKTISDNLIFKKLSSTGVMVAPQVSILMVGVRFPCAANSANF